MDFLKLSATALLSLAMLFVSTKLMGHRQLAQLDFFDYINGITIGSIAAELATDLEAPWKSMTALIVYTIVSIGLCTLTHKLPRTRKYINGSPTVLMDHGKLYRDNLKKSKLDLSEFLVLCREQGYFDLSEIQTAVFEHNGRLSILPVSEKRPVTPSDLSLHPTPAHILTEVVMDGRMLEENLRRMKRSVAWLNQQLQQQGVTDIRSVFLALCDENGAISVYLNTQADGKNRYNNTK